MKKLLITFLFLFFSAPYTLAENITIQKTSSVNILENRDIVTFQIIVRNNETTPQNLVIKDTMSFNSKNEIYGNKGGYLAYYKNISTTFNPPTSERFYGHIKKNDGVKIYNLQPSSTVTITYKMKAWDEKLAWNQYEDIISTAYVYKANREIAKSSKIIKIKGDGVGKVIVDASIFAKNYRETSPECDIVRKCDTGICNTAQLSSTEIRNIISQDTSLGNNSAKTVRTVYAENNSVYQPITLSNSNKKIHVSSASANNSLTEFYNHNPIYEYEENHKAASSDNYNYYVNKPIYLASSGSNEYLILMISFLVCFVGYVVRRIIV